MRNITVHKNNLLATLQGNRETHIADFDIAWEAFRKKAEENMVALLKRLRNAPHGGEVQLWIGLDPPVNHVEDYDRAIEMLGWAISDEIELSEGEFRQLVQDEWGWSAQVAASNMLYTGSQGPSGDIGVRDAKE